MAASQPTAKYAVRLYDVDDVATLYVNGTLAFEAKYGYSGLEPNWSYIGDKPGDAGEIDITSILKMGENILRIQLWNDQICCGVSVSFQIKENDMTIFSDTFSEQDSNAGIKYDKTITLIAK